MAEVESVKVEEVPSVEHAESKAEREEMLEEWRLMEEEAEEMVPLLGKLYRKHNTIVALFEQKLSNLSVLDLIRVHDEAATAMGVPVSISHSKKLLQAVADLKLPPCRVDLGKLSAILASKLGSGLTAEGVRGAVAELAASHPVPETLRSTATNVVLFGFGRIGRLVARVLAKKTGAGSKMLLRAIVLRPRKKHSLRKRALLLKHDSVHGDFEGRVEVDEERQCLILNGLRVQIIYAEAPDKVDYLSYGISDAFIIDNTGKFRERETLGRHLAAPGASKVILTAPGRGAPAVPTTIVAGVNDDRVSDGESLYSAASCTTNAIVPVLQLMDRKYGIISGHVETVHSFTNDQNLIDNYHDKNRRGRSAALNMVLTETGAAKAVAVCLPEMAGKLTASAIRVPTPDVSMAILILTLREEVTKKEVNDYLLRESVVGPLHRQVQLLQVPELVSTDLVGNTHASIVDGEATIASGNRVNLYVWYDNEYGYSCQVVRLMQMIGGVKHPSFPVREAMVDLASPAKKEAEEEEEEEAAA